MSDCAADPLDKKMLRRSLRARRTSFVQQSGAAGDLLIATLMLGERVVDRFGDARIVAAYVGDGEEVDPLPILLNAIDQGRGTALPRVTAADAPMRFHHWLPGDPLEMSPLGTLQPTASAEQLTPDLFVTPLVGFDRAGTRLGQGAGFYDRAFAAEPGARRVGLGWAVQEVPSLPADAWDVPLHGVATEAEWIAIP